MMGPRNKPTGAVATSPTCGIVGIFDTSDDVVGIRQKARLMSSLQRHRGPDWSGTHVADDGDYTSVIAHERLSIVDPDSGEQPLFSEDMTVSLAANGEICAWTYTSFLRTPLGCLLPVQGQLTLLACGRQPRKAQGGRGEGRLLLVWLRLRGHHPALPKVRRVRRDGARCTHAPSLLASLGGAGLGSSAAPAVSGARPPVAVR